MPAPGITVSTGNWYKMCVGSPGGTRMPGDAERASKFLAVDFYCGAGGYVIADS